MILSELQSSRLGRDRFRLSLTDRKQNGGAEPRRLISKER
jgi:hypothetical protein